MKHGLSKDMNAVIEQALVNIMQQAKSEGSCGHCAMKNTAGIAMFQLFNMVGALKTQDLKSLLILKEAGEEVHDMALTLAAAFLTSPKDFAEVNLSEVLSRSKH